MVNTAIAARKMVRAPKRSATQPLAGMKIATLSRYDVMARLSRTGLTPNDAAICGSAVAITVPSRFSMNSAQATVRAMIAERSRRRIGITRGGEGEGAAILSRGRCRYRGHYTLDAAAGMGEAIRQTAIIIPSPACGGRVRVGDLAARSPAVIENPVPPPTHPPPQAGEGYFRRDSGAPYAPALSSRCCGVLETISA